MTQIDERIFYESQKFQNVIHEISKVLVGQNNLITKLVIALLADGHVLIEGVPGLAKTLAVRALADAINAPFRRIQFTSDLLPADLIGTQIYNPQTLSFEPRYGPIYSSIILADEINRAPAKVQSALLEAMEERQFTLGEQTVRLGIPFMVLATQNPIEHEGTYVLPEAQLDRFMFKLLVSYPTRLEEKNIVQRMALTVAHPRAQPVVNERDIVSARTAMSRIVVTEKLVDYVLDIVLATRGGQPKFKDLNPFIRLGASPRATLALINGARAYALLYAANEQRNHLVPDDVRAIAHDVLRHRIMLTFEAEAEGVTVDDLIERILRMTEP